MPSARVAPRNRSSIKIRYEVHGSGRPVLLLHGDDLDGSSRERHEQALVDAGYRTITYAPDSFGADLDTLLEHLDLDEVILVGFSTAAHDVTRYLADHGSARVSKAALVGVIPPFLRRLDEDPARIDGRIPEDLKMAVIEDRYGPLKDFVDNFDHLDVVVPRPDPPRVELIDEADWWAEFDAAGGRPQDGGACIDAWTTDFPRDLPEIDVPLLVVHGTEDRVLPISNTADRLHELARNMHSVRVEGGPHKIGWTHSDQVNSTLLEFLKEPVGAARPAIAA